MYITFCVFVSRITMSLNNISTRFIHNLCKRTFKSYYSSTWTKLTAHCKQNYLVISKRNFQYSAVLSGTAGHAETTTTTQGLSKLQAQELVLRLNDEERSILTSALHEYRSKLVKDEFEGK